MEWDHRPGSSGARSKNVNTHLLSFRSLAKLCFLDLETIAAGSAVLAGAVVSWCSRRPIAHKSRLNPRASCSHFRTAIISHVNDHVNSKGHQDALMQISAALSFGTVNHMANPTTQPVSVALPARPGTFNVGIHLGHPRLVELDE